MKMKQIDMMCTQEAKIPPNSCFKIEDYISGLAPESFKKFVTLIRKFESALGSSYLKINQLENENLPEDWDGVYRATTK